MPDEDARDTEADLMEAGRYSLPAVASICGLALGNWATLQRDALPVTPNGKVEVLNTKLRRERGACHNDARVDRSALQNQDGLV